MNHCPHCGKQRHESERVVCWNCWSYLKSHDPELLMTYFPEHEQSGLTIAPELENLPITKG